MDTPRRAVPRLSFTGRPAPRLETGVGTYEVVDLSPEGIRIRFEEAPAGGVTIGDVLRATIRFPADRAVEVEGKVLRVNDHEAALQLTNGQDRLALSPLPAGPASPRRTGLLW
jgi:hypothetical protein